MITFNRMLPKITVLPTFIVVKVRYAVVHEKYTVNTVILFRMKLDAADKEINIPTESGKRLGDSHSKHAAHVLFICVKFVCKQGRAATYA